MSIVASTSQQIHNSPLNTSSAKMLYSFPKTLRFQEQYQGLCDQFYPLPSMKDKRAAGIGYGTKYDFVKAIAANPAPNQYQMKSEVQIATDKHLGWTLGIGREKTMQFGIFANGSERNPGPGKYDTKNTLSNIRYTMRPKPHMKSSSELQNVPGPGTYTSVPIINEKAKHHPNSKYVSYGSTVFAPASSVRFLKDLTLNVPGPGSYKSNGLDPQGKYFNSKFGSSQCRTFTHSLRKDIAGSSVTPGPGNYRLPSDFGYYESAKNKKQN